MHHHNNTDAANIIGFILMIGLFVVIAIAIQMTRKRLEDPGDKGVVYLGQLLSVAALAGSGRYLVWIYRQSGNVHSSFVITGSATAALLEVVTVFRRANIEAVGLIVNTPNELSVRRAFMNYRGRSHGKRVGSAIIKRDI